MGPNGSGKTTLFHIIMGLLKPVSGNIEIFGKPAREEKDFIDVRKRIGLLFQDADDQLFSPTVQRMKLLILLGKLWNSLILRDSRTG